MRNKIKKNEKNEKCKSEKEEGKSRSFFSIVKSYAFPIIIAIVLWYYLNAFIFNQVKSKQSFKKNQKKKKKTN